MVTKREYEAVRNQALFWKACAWGVAHKKVFKHEVLKYAFLLSFRPPTEEEIKEIQDKCYDEGEEK